MTADLESRRVPAAVFRLPRDLLARFLNRVLGVAATVWRPHGGEPGRVAVAVRSAGLARDLQHLLLRFGIGAVVENRRRGGRPGDVGRARGAHRGCRQPRGARRRDRPAGPRGRVGAVVAHARAVRDARRPGVDASPRLRRGSGAGRGSDLLDRAAASGMGADAVSAAAGSIRPRRHARSRDGAVLWDDIVAIDDEGDVQVYDLTVPGTHNFVAADVFVHNTSFALGMASHAALHANKPVLLFSLEMGSLELSQRLLSAEARIDSRRVRTGQLSEDDWSRISQAIGRLAAAPIWIDDNPNLTVMEIRSKARRLKSQVGDLGMVVVDYLQLMTGRGNAENRQVEVSEMSRGLKILARELETPVVALSQLSRQLELRADKRPMLADLREAGSIEQDADVVMFIYRDDVYHSDSADRGQAEIIVSKHRNGPTGVCRLAFLEQFTRFANMAKID